MIGFDVVINLITWRKKQMVLASPVRMCDTGKYHWTGSQANLGSKPGSSFIRVHSAFRAFISSTIKLGNSTCLTELS